LKREHPVICGRISVQPIVVHHAQNGRVAVRIQAQQIDASREEDLAARIDQAGDRDLEWLRDWNGRRCDDRRANRRGTVIANAAAVTPLTQTAKHAASSRMASSPSTPDAFS
jgi:hypothetical protein